MKPVKILLAKIPLTALAFMALFPTDPALAQGGRYEGRRMGRGMMSGWGLGWFGGFL